MVINYLKSGGNADLTALEIVTRRLEVAVGTYGLQPTPLEYFDISSAFGAYYISGWSDYGANEYNNGRITTLVIPTKTADNHTIVSVSQEAFAYYPLLRTLVIPVNIMASAFENEADEPDGATTVLIGSGVTFIGANAFKRQHNLTSITIRATTPPTLDSTSAFQYTNDCPIYVPAESVTAYQTATNWSAYASRIQAEVI